MSTSGLAVLPKSVITPRGQMVHCHQTVQETQAVLANPGMVAALGEARRVYSPTDRATSNPGFESARDVEPRAP